MPPREHADMLPLTSLLNVHLAHPARVYDCWLGGKDNYAPDRQVADAMVAQIPETRQSCLDNRGFLVRAVHHLAERHGLRQFLDLGSGLSVLDATHEIAQSIAPEAAVVYADNDPLVLDYTAALLASLTDEGTVEYLQADIRDPEHLLDAAADILDTAQPIAALLSQVLGHITDDAQARDILSQLAAGLPHGSFLVIADGVTTLPAALAWAQEDYNHTAQPYELRDAPRLARLLDGLDLLPPGLVGCCDWRPEVAALAPAPAVEPLAAIARTPTQPGVPE